MTHRARRLLVLPAVLATLLVASHEPSQAGNSYPPVPAETPNTPRAPKPPRAPRYRAYTTVVPEVSPTAVTETTFTVRPASRLELNNFSGDIRVVAWDKNVVQVRALHGTRSRVEVESGGRTVVVRGLSLMGVPHRIDYKLQVPTWMGLALSGVSGDVSIAGSRGDVSVETVKGDVDVEGGVGFVNLSAIEGQVTLRSARGRIAASSVNSDVCVSDAAGPLEVETVNGDISLSRILSDSVAASSVNGELLFDGAFRDHGSYRFFTHNGDIVVAMPENTSAAVMVSTYSGDFESTFGVRLPGLEDTPRKRSFRFTLGSGGAQVQLESFQGAIQICRPGEVPADREGRCGSQSPQQVYKRLIKERVKAHKASKVEDQTPEPDEEEKP